jgi:hypothetical protein
MVIKNSIFHVVSTSVKETLKGQNELLTEK